MSEEQYAKFGRLVYDWMRNEGEFLFAMEVSDDLCQLGERAGLIVRVSYDPEKHGDGIEAEPGDPIWFFHGAKKPGVAGAAGLTKGESA